MVQTADRARARGALEGGARPLPAVSPYGPPPGIFVQILRTLGLWSDAAADTGSGASDSPAPASGGPTPAATPAAPAAPTFEQALAKAIADANTSAIVKLGTDDVSRGKVIDAVTAAGAVQIGGFLGNLSVTGAAAWRTAMTNTRYDAFVGAAANIADQIQYNTMWALYHDPAARSDQAASLTWGKLYTAQILPAGNTTVVWPGGTSTNADGVTTFQWRTLYMPVGAAPQTMKRLMVGVRPLPRGHVNLASIAFVFQSQSQYKQTAPTAGAWTSRGAATNLTTSYYLNTCSTVVIVTDAGGNATNDFAIGNAAGDQTGGVGGVQGGPGLTWFLNHVRHEVGHAVGDSALEGVPEKGNDFATTYGGWTASSTAEATSGAYWGSAAAKKITLSGTEHDVTAAACSAWVAGLVETGAELAGNAITALAGTVPEKLTAIRQQYPENLVNYVWAVTGGGTNLSCKDGAYRFGGYTPPATVIIWSSRFNPAGWTKYSKAAYDACVPKMGWYSVSSPVEMFAEMYTHKYSGGTLPAAVNGKDPAALFKKMDESGDSQFATSGEGASATPTNPAPAPAPAAPLPAG